MEYEKLSNALNEISGSHIAEAAAHRKRTRLPWIGAVAALLALVLVFQLPGSIQAKAVSVADYPKYEWLYRGEEMEGYVSHLNSFFTESMSTILADAGDDNCAYSPVNLYMALSVSAELTEGGTRQQVLDTLGTDSMDALRQQANTVWNACYYDDNDQVLLANSLWLDTDIDYNKSTMDTLAENYYTSVYQGDFGSDKTSKAVTAWLDQQTENLLTDSTAQIELPEETVLAAYSTVYYRAMWSHGTEFDAANNTAGVFHAPEGDVHATFMNKDENVMAYYWGTDFGAVSLGLRDGSQMWFILPDADKAPADVVEAGEYLPFVLGSHECSGEACDNHTYIKVNLSIPKFDIQANGDLKEAVQKLGITDIFQPGTADFSAITAQTPAWLSAVNQATRVAIDEEGVTAASYIELPSPGAMMPPEEIIDFTLDRPFLFVITNRYDVPLFAGIVNDPS